MSKRAKPKRVEPPRKAAPAIKSSLQQMRDKIAQACLDDIKVVLEKHKCQLGGVPRFTPDGAGGFKVTVAIDIQPME